VPLRSLETGEVRATLRHQGAVNGVDWHKDLNLLAVGTEQAEIFLWNLAEPHQPLRVRILTRAANQ
jgi:hypothetical protein